MELNILVANETHFVYANELCQLIESASKARGTGIAKRSPEYLQQKMIEGKAVIAMQGQILAGFCYIESWSHDAFVANSGLVVKPIFRKTGLGFKIKEAIFDLSRAKYPNAKIFGITTSLAVMKINSSLGYKPVTFSELTTDDAFWKGCQGCVNYDILQRTERVHCLCTGMAYTPEPVPDSASKERGTENSQSKHELQICHPT